MSTTTRPPAATSATAARDDRIWRWVPVVTTVVLVGGTALIEPSVIADIFASGQAVLVTLGVIAGLVGLTALLRATVPLPWARAAIMVAVQLVIAVVLLLPYTQDNVVDEALPGADAAAAPAEDSAGQADAEPDAAAPAEQPSAATGAEAPADQPGTAVGGEDAPAAPAEPVQVASGTLAGIDHDATGGAAVYTLPDGSSIVRFEEIEVENGPDYRVYLVPDAAAESPTDGAIDLGPLTGNVGSSNYTLPAGTALDGDLTVLIWCRAFAVPIAHAPLTPA